MWIVSPQEIVLIVATVVQLAAIYQHAKVTHWAAWARPFQLYGLCFTIMIIPRLIAQLGRYNLVPSGYPNAISTVCFLIDSILLFSAGRAMRRMVIRDIEDIEQDERRSVEIQEDRDWGEA